MRGIVAALRGLRADERGVEIPAMIIVLPVLMVLVLGLIDVGMAVRTRIVVENITRDAVRQAAADGGNFNPRTNQDGVPRDALALRALWGDRGCQPSGCLPGQRPTIDCTLVTPAGGGPSYRSNVAQRAGDVITCTTFYPYKAINKALLDGPLGLGIGSMLRVFTVTSSARAETGANG